MHRPHAAFALAALLTAGTVAAQDKSEFSDMTTKKLQDKFVERMKVEEVKTAFDKTIKVDNYDYRVDASGIVYSYDAANKKPKLLWRYKSEQRATEAVKTQIKSKLGDTFPSVFGQMFTPQQIKDLQDELVVSPFNTAPRISTPLPSREIDRGVALAVPFTVGDDETAPAKLTLTPTTSDPAQLPASGLVLGGSGADRVLTVTVPTGRTDRARVTVSVKVTDEDGLTDTATFTLLIAGAGGELPTMPPEPLAMPIGTYFPSPNYSAYGYAAPAWGYPPRVYYNYGAPAWPLYPYPIHGVRSGSLSAAPTSAPKAGVANAERVIPREELVKGLAEADWVELYDAGYRKYWAGNHAQAREYCAAAIELKNDPRAWYYLALALDALGDGDRATAAAHYAARLVLDKPQTEAETNDALRRVQGALRERLSQMETETPAGVRVDVRHAARPKLPSMSPTGTAVVATRP